MMRASNRYYTQLLAGFVFLLISCEKKTDPDPNNGNTSAISAQTKYINNWISDGMNEVYLWEEYIPAGLVPDTEPDPEEFFDKFLYDLDRFSWIHNDYDGLMGQYYGVQESIGYSLAFGRIGGTDTLFAIVEYVYRDSPADSAGLKRGDIILEMDGLPLTVFNYLDIYQTNSFTVTLGESTPGSISLTNTIIPLEARVIAEDPAVYWDVLEADGHKIGYLAYVSFTSGQTDEYLHTLNTVL
jgi:methionine-rich copper-binding protein CopC